MKHFLIIITLLLFTSCKKEKTTTATPPTTTGGAVLPTSAQTDFSQYYNKFLAYATAKGVTPNTSNLTLTYDSQSLADRDVRAYHHTADGTLGICTTYTNGSRILSINRYYWEAWASSGRKDDMEQLFFHELGHCTLSRSHYNITDSGCVMDNLQSCGGNGIGLSLMAMYHINTTYYKANHTYYINELFNSSLVSNIALNTSGNQFDGSPYASHIASKYSMTVSNMYENNNENELDENSDIEEFRCDNEILEN